jgi:hypothetical protein
MCSSVCQRKSPKIISKAGFRYLSERKTSKQTNKQRIYLLINGRSWVMVVSLWLHFHSLIWVTIPYVVSKTHLVRRSFVIIFQHIIGLNPRRNNVNILSYLSIIIGIFVLKTVIELSHLGRHLTHYKCISEI